MASTNSNEELNLFKVLDLPMDSPADKARKKCQELLLKLHPDKNGGEETPEFHKVQKLRQVFFVNS